MNLNPIVSEMVVKRMQEEYRREAEADRQARSIRDRQAGSPALARLGFALSGLVFLAAVVMRFAHV